MATGREVPFGVIGCGLMGREFASAAARWIHLLDVGVRPVVVAACDVNLEMARWFEDNLPSVRYATTDYRKLLDDPAIEAIYCAVPHDLHAQIYGDIIAAGKHLMGEKPFGINRKANSAIMDSVRQHPGVLVRCSSEFPFYPGAYQVYEWIREGRLGEIIEIEAGFWHSSDLNPLKPINWKRMIDINGEYGCMGDLGMHVAHLPLRFGWRPKNVRALLSNIVRERPDGKGGTVPCETWDNAILATEVEAEESGFPMMLSMKRIAPGHANTWFIRVFGTEFSAAFSTKNPKEIRSMRYEPGGEQNWQVADMPFRSAYPSITGGIFEFGFPDAILQMWAAFCDELERGDDMQQPLRCATPEEARQTHVLFSGALRSQAERAVVELDWSV